MGGRRKAVGGEWRVEGWRVEGGGRRVEGGGGGMWCITCERSLLTCVHGALKMQADPAVSVAKVAALIETSQLVARSQGK